MKSVKLLDIPAEIIEHVLIYADPFDVAKFAQTCRVARSLVYGARDQHLWRNLFLSQSFDDPREWLEPSLSSSPPASSLSSTSVKSSSIDWRDKLQRRVRAATIAHHFDDAEPDERKRTLEELISVVTDAPPVTSTNMGRLSKSLAWLSEITDGGNILSFSPRDSERTEEEQQLLARLRTYVSLSELDKTGPHAESLRTVSRCLVYDLRNYTEESLWGPFLPNGSGHVNWKHVHAILTAMCWNIKELGEDWPLSRPSAGLESTRAYSATGVLNRNSRDWAGVEGTWRRYVCFMDYRDLFAFNFSTSHYHGPRDPSFFETEDFHEAIRLIELEFHITKVVEAGRSSASASSSLSQLPTPRRPNLHFIGISRGGESNEARVRGVVSITPDGQIRWRIVSTSIYEGRQQWSSEGVQIGNVGCAAGVVGTWTGAQHEDGDPAGPFWLWKVEENHMSYLQEEED